MIVSGSRGDVFGQLIKAWHVCIPVAHGGREGSGCIHIAEGESGFGRYEPTSPFELFRFFGNTAGTSHHPGLLVALLIKEEGAIHDTGFRVRRRAATELFEQIPCLVDVTVTAETTETVHLEWHVRGVSGQTPKSSKFTERLVIFAEAVSGEAQKLTNRGCAAAEILGF